MLTGYAFDLSGGRLALDFANTLSRSSGEHLTSYAELVSFARQAGQLDALAAGRLLERIASPDRPSVEYLVAPRLVIRASSAQPVPLPQEADR